MIKTEKIKQPNDIVITTGYQYYYYYNWEEPDYYIRPQEDYACKMTEDNCQMRYMENTYLLNDFSQLKKIVDYSINDIYFVLNMEAGHPENEYIISNWLKELNVIDIYTGEEEKAIIYKLNKSNSL
jgi:hypothetical protein